MPLVTAWDGGDSSAAGAEEEAVEAVVVGEAEAAVGGVRKARLGVLNV